MNTDRTRMIEAWFAENSDDSEFAGCDRAHPYSVVGSVGSAGRIIFTTKPTVVSLIIHRCRTSERLGMIGRYGVPTKADLRWIRKVIGPQTLFFLGDLDPVDLMVFAWLRAALHQKHLTHLGVNDKFLKAIKTSTTKTFSLPCSPSEQQSLPVVKRVLPDLDRIVGNDCNRLLEQGRKIELDGVGADRRTPEAVARLVERAGPGLDF